MTDPRPPGDPGTAADEQPYYVLGGRAMSRSLARRLRAKGHDVELLGGTNGANSGTGDAVESDATATAAVPPGSTVVVATRSDGRNLRVANLLRARADVDRVLVLVNSPGRVEAFSEAGHEPVCATTALSKTLVDCL
ncbi:potassium transporter TrkA [Halobacteriales archaeon QS_6_71_20]|nr:MAG: potassium transporter TrkA [Halobacteriales archaeon QS_6_71_20]